jgi:mannosylfructose-phosphate synthase
MAHNKGYDLLLRAMPPVFKRVEDAKLLLAVGSTEPTEREREQVAELKDLANSLGIADRVIFRDFIPDEELADFYRMADVFALCSRYEPFGMTAIEAMACGTPTALTTEGGLWEQITWGLEALYANPFDPEAYGHAICTVLQHPGIADQLALYGSKKARADFTWNGIAQQILRVTQTMPQQATAPRKEVECRTERPRPEPVFSTMD